MAVNASSCVIYMIKNIVNGKVYIGQSVNFETRRREHLKSLNKGKHVNKHLQSAWNKYGQHNFEFFVIEECTEDKLTEREQYWIDYYGGLDSPNNYNKRDASSKGHLSKETKQKISASNKGRVVTLDMRQHHSNMLKGVTPWNKGLTKDDPRVAKHIHKKGEFHHAEETKLKISQHTKGKTKVFKDPVQHAKNISEGQKGRVRSEKELQHLRTVGKGRIWVNNGTVSKMIYPEQLNDYLQNNFKPGRGGTYERKDSCS